MKMIFSVLLMLNIAQSALASSPPPKEKKDDKHGAEAAPEEDEETKAKNQRELYEITTRYKHSWIKMPPITGKSIVDDDTVAVKNEPGMATVVFFLASWCEPCQKITPDMLAMQKKFARLPVRFVYVFTSDTKQDAQGFAKEYKVPDGILANHDILKAYHGPELPTIYVGDRHNWITKRFLKADSNSLKEIEEFLTLITGI